MFHQKKKNLDILHKPPVYLFLIDTLILIMELKHMKYWEI